MRLVASTVTLGAASSKSPTAELPSTSCSRLSSTSNTSRSARCRRRPLARSRPGASRTLSTPAIAEVTSVGSVSGLRSTKNTPSGNRSSCLEAVSSASLVFPVPPGPVSVSSRVSPRSRSMSPIARARPTNEVRRGRRLVLWAPRVRNAGKSALRPSITRSCSRSGCSRPFRSCSPRSRNVTPSGTSPATRTRVASDITIWPPWPAAAIRAARLTSIPT